MPTVSKQLTSFLDVQGVDYETIHHRPKYTAQQIVADTHTPGNEFAKTVMLKVDGEDVMAVLPAHLMVDCDKLRQALGATEVRLADEGEIRELIRDHCPDCELGAIPPFGSLYGLLVCIDPMMVVDDYVTFNAGTHEDVIRMAYADYERLVTPRVMGFSRHVEPSPQRHDPE